jgi:NADPH:quinone reductase-like Zn-dependent oxidoreductase
MKAFVHDRYGSPDVLELKDVDIPTGNDDQVLVRIRAACVNPYDWHMLRGHPYLGPIPIGRERASRRALS